jgi:hypothetical protein
MTEIEKAQKMFREIAATELVELIDELVAEEVARWRRDPEVVGVVGVVLESEPNRALVVVYLDDEDFSYDDARLSALAAGLKS